MGAIYGFTGDFKEEEKLTLLKKMQTPVRFRGRDAEDMYCNVKIGMGACIRKTFTTSKPVIANENNSIFSICDGEIYNWKELADDLLSKGHHLPNMNDTEIIVHLYEEYGLNFPKLCNGVFGIGIWDIKQQRLVLSRDHMGNKNIFYFQKQGLMLFSSTIKGLMASQIIPPELDVSSVHQYFSSTTVYHPNTILQNVYSVRPGHSMVFEARRTYEKKYWAIDAIRENYKVSFGDWKSQIRKLVVDSIKIRQMEDKKIGSVLSGGVDSSVISSVLQQKKGSKLDVFSITFDENQYNDSPLQQVMLDQYQLDQHLTVVRPQNVPQLLHKVIDSMDSPVSNASAMGTYSCFAMAKNKVDVIFDGEGADELFCGGGGVLGDKQVGLFNFLPQQFRKLLFGSFGNSLYLDQPGYLSKFKRLFYRISLPEYERMLTWLPAFDAVTRKKLLNKSFYNKDMNLHVLDSCIPYLVESRLQDQLNLYQYGACKTYLCDDLIYKNERMAAATGIINRSPFVDYRLAELAFQIPAKYKLPGYTKKKVEKKYIYRCALEGLIPDPILSHRKVRGFSQPTPIWIRKELKSFVLDTLLGDKAKQRGILNHQYIKKILRQHFNSTMNHDRLIWSMLTFELWMNIHFDNYSSTSK